MVDVLLTFYEVIRPIFSNVVLALITLLLGFVFGRIAGGFIQRLLAEIHVNGTIMQVTGLRIKLEEIIGKIISGIIYFIAIVMSLDQLGLKVFLINIISVGFLLLILISLVLAIKDFIPNVIAGFFIIKKRSVKAGDRIKFQSIEGTIESISFVETKIQANNGDIIFIPNSLLTKQQFTSKKRKERLRKNSKL